MNTNTKKRRIRTAFAAAAVVAASLPFLPATANADALKIVPGDKITVARDGGALSGCTVGPYMSLGNGKYGALTAGHCGEDGDPVYWNDGTGRGKLVSHLYQPVAEKTAEGVNLDYAMIPLRDDQVSPSVQGANIVDLATLEELQEASLRRDIPLCSVGITSGFRCGKLHSISFSQKLLVSDFKSDHGDSGGPVWIPTKKGAQIVGILYGGVDSTGRSLITPIEIPLEAYAAKLTVDRV